MVKRKPILPTQGETGDIKLLINLKMNEKDKTYWLAWSHILEGRQLKKLFDHFADGEEAWRATEPEFQRLGFQAETLQKINAERRQLDPERVLEKVKKADTEVVCLGDPDYPSRLAQIYDAPIVLFYRGRLPAAEEILIAIVGTRMVSRYGQTVTIAFTRELAQGGLGIVSGLARGIDALAHETTLEVGGRTIGVLGNGLLNTDIYPREYVKMAQKIIERGGCIMSEYPPGVGPERHHFPERNRIIAGLTVGTLVIEAPETSGALITAKLALEYNREVMAVPGNIFEKNSIGTNELIKLGARMVTSPEDIKEALQLQDIAGAKIERRPEMTKDETMIINTLSKNPIHIDLIYKSVDLDNSIVGSVLTLLELKGIVKDIGGKYYIRLIEP